jgi:hypothetical protein
VLHFLCTTEGVSDAGRKRQVWESQNGIQPKSLRKFELVVADRSVVDPSSLIISITQSF